MRYIMSIVIAVASTNFALMMSDGRKTLFENGIPTNEYHETTKKMVRLNSNICLGFSGDYDASQIIVESFELFNCKQVSLEMVVECVVKCAKAITLRELPLLIIIAGKDSNNKFCVVPVSSKNNYQYQFEYPDKHHNFAFQFACPFYDKNEFDNLVTERIYSKMNTIKTVDELIFRLENLIKNVANKTTTVNKVIYREMIT